MGRKKNRKDKKKLKKYTKLYIEGETEEIYFSYISKKHRFKISIEPEPLHNLPISKEKLDFIYNRLKKDVKNESVENIHIILELDHYLNSGNTEYIKEVKGFIEKVKKLGVKNIYIIYPCIELWFLFHFQYTESSFKNCSDVVDYIKNNLCKILNGFINNLKNQIWLKNNYHHIFNGDIDEQRINTLITGLRDLKDKFCESNKFSYEKNCDEFLDMLTNLGLEKFAIYNAQKLGNFSFERKNLSVEIYLLVDNLIYS